MDKNQKVYGVIMAAGKGTRMNATDIPKVMFPVNGRPMVRYVYDAMRSVADEIVMVVGFQGEKIIDEFKDEPVKFVWQKEQLGTAHSALQAESLLRGKDGVVIITNGDHPLYTAASFTDMAQAVMNEGYTLVIRSAVEDKHTSYGRVVRDTSGRVTGIVEAKDATAEQQAIREKNCGIYVAKADWVWPALKKIQPSSVSEEYYITDLVELAIKDGEPVEAMPIESPEEISGVNTPEELAEIEAILNSRAQ